MALLGFDGFDWYVNGSSLTNDFWDNPTIAGIATGRFGVDGCISLSFGNNLVKTFGSNISEIILGGGEKHENTGANGSFVFNDGSTTQCSITWEADGSIALRRGSTSGTIVAQTAASFVAFNAWYGMSYRVKFSGSVGEFQIYKEGASAFTATGLNNISTANAYFNKLTLCGSGSAHTWYDDFYILDTTGGADNTFPGDTRVYALPPNGAGSSTQFTIGAGGQPTNWQTVNQQNNVGDSKYVSDATVNDMDEYTLTDMPSGFAGTVISFATYTTARKDDAGVRQLVASINSNGTIEDGATQTMTSAYACHVDFHRKNPDGNVDWTKTTINALKIRVKVAA